MRKTTIGALFIGILAATACGGDEAEPPKTPEPPVPTPTVTASAPPVATEPTTPPVAPKPPMSELQLATGKAVSEALNAHDAKKFAAVYAEDAKLNLVGLGEVTGRDAIATETQKWFDAFSDLKFGIGRIFQKGDMAVVEWVATGTHSGDFLGIKATQKPMGIHGASVIWFNADGHEVKEHRYFDLVTLLGQLGVMKQPPVRTAAALPAAIEPIPSKDSPEEAKNLEAHKAAAAAMDAKKDADFLNFITDDSQYDEYSMKDTIKGKKGAKAWFAGFVKAFPDGKTESNTHFAAGDFVVLESTFTGTHKGALGPLAATNKPVTLHSVEIAQMKDGKYVHGWGYSNSKELLEQIGKWKAPTPAPAPAAPAAAKAGAAPPAAAKPAGTTAPAPAPAPAPKKVP
jgi:steroid delta-isomerase-like uncharacterized protein